MTVSELKIYVEDTAILEILDKDKNIIYKGSPKHISAEYDSLVIVHIYPKNTNAISLQTDTLENIHKRIENFFKQ